MQSLADLVKCGCYFCKQPLTVETADVGTVSYSIVGTNVWCKPFVVVSCKACTEKYAEKSDGSEPGVA